MKDPALWSTFVREFPSIISDYETYTRKSTFIQKQYESGTNILLYSSVGFPLDLFLHNVATNMFGEFTKKECCFEKAVTYHETPYFIDIDFNHPSNKKSLDAIGELIKSIISTVCIHSATHLIFCRNIEYIESKYMFRVLLERFNKNARFICTTYAVSTLETPIRSRFLEVRIPLFTMGEIEGIFKRIGVNATYQPASRNILKSIALADMQEQGHDTSLSCSYNYPLIKSFMEKKTHNITDIREFANKVCTHCIPFGQVVTDLLQHVSDTQQFVRNAADLEHRLAQTNGGRRPLYYEMLFQIAIYGTDK